MVVVCRALANLVGFVLLAALAIAGLAVAAFSLGGDDGGWSLAGLARLIGLPELSDTVGDFLDGFQADGGVDVVAALSGIGALLLAVALLVGTLVARRERLLVFSRDSEGSLSARRRALAHAVEALAEQPRDVSAARAKLRPHRRRSGGRLRLRFDHARTADGDKLEGTVRDRIASLVAATSLSVRVRDRVPRRGGRVR